MGWGSTVWGYVKNPETIFGMKAVVQPASTETPADDKPLITKVGETIGGFVGNTTAAAVKPMFMYLLIAGVVITAAYVITKRYT